MVVDVDSGKILKQKNANKKIPPASLTKKMTLYLLFDAIKKRKINFRTKFVVSKKAEQQIPSKLNLKAKETIDVKTIIEALIIKSANDVAIVAAEGIAGSVEKFVKMMNVSAKKLGMHRTKFYNPSGVPDKRQHTTARDMAILARAMLKDFPEFFSFFRTRSFKYKKNTFFTHNHLLDKFQGTNGIKTGYIEASGYNVTTSVIRYDQSRKKHHLLCVVIGKDSSSERDKEAIDLLEPIFLKRKAVFYNVNACIPSCKTGIPIEKNNRIVRDAKKPVFLRAQVCTKNGMCFLLDQYSNENKFTVRKCSAKMK